MSMANQARQSGEPLPDRIANAPELRLGLELYLNAFLDLDSERSHAMGVSPIKWSSIMDYANAFQMCVTQTEDLLFFVRRMDSSHLARIKSKNTTPGK